MKTTTFNINLTISPVAYWAYEKAFCTEYIAELGGHLNVPEEEAKYVREMHDKFCKLFDVYVDNKQTFKVWCHSWHCDKQHFLYVTFHDNRMFVGLNIRPYRGAELPKPTKVCE